MLYLFLLLDIKTKPIVKNKNSIDLSTKPFFSILSIQEDKLKHLKNK